MRTKIIDLNDDRILKAGENRITPMVKTAYGYEPDDRLSKSAACDDARAFAAGIQSEPGKRVILNVSFGSFEAWGDNKKGDAFPEAAIHGYWPKDIDRSHFDKHNVRIPKEWGIRTFPTKFNDEGHQIGGANTYYEHRNKTPKILFGVPYDPNNPNDPRCGYVLAAFWNTEMHRVEVIQEVWEHKLPMIVKRIDLGDYPGISMACNIPFDRCLRCGNLAVKEADYCEHLNRRSERRGAIASDGKGNVMINDFPVFFDNTITDNPAAEEGETLEKVASLDGMEDPRVGRRIVVVSRGNLSNHSEEPTCEDMDRVKRLQTLRLQEEPFPDPVVKHLKKYPLFEIFKYLAAIGIYPTGEDIVNLSMNRSRQDAHGIGSIAERFMSSMVSGGIQPDRSYMHKVIIPIKGPGGFDPNTLGKIVNLVRDLMPLKSYLPGYLNLRPKNANILHIDTSKLPKRYVDDANSVLGMREHIDPQIIAAIRQILRENLLNDILASRTLGTGKYDMGSMPIYRPSGSTINPDSLAKLYK